jgi:hypothetical protein
MEAVENIIEMPAAQRGKLLKVLGVSHVGLSIRAVLNVDFRRAVIFWLHRQQSVSEYLRDCSFGGKLSDLPFDKKLKRISEKDHRVFVNGEQNEISRVSS